MVPANQQQEAYSSQSQDGEGKGEERWGVVSILAVAMCVHEFGGGASDGAPKKAMNLFGCYLSPESITHALSTF